MSAFIRSLLSHELRKTFPIRKSKERRDFSWRFLPYCAKLLPCGRVIILNRDYKPLGIKTAEHVDYDRVEFDYSKIEIDVLPVDIKFAIMQDGVFFFYRDDTSPRYNNTMAHQYVDRIEAAFLPLLVGAAQ